MGSGTSVDVRGLPVTAASAQAVAALDDVVAGLVSHRADTPLRLERALSLDPELALAHVVRGFALRLLARRDLLPDALAARDRARASMEARGATRRETLLLAALDRWLDGDPRGAIEALEADLALHPHDLLAVKLSHALQFVLGLHGGMRRSVERVLPAWSDHVPGHAFVLGCHAFALEETGELRRAERVGRRAAALDATDVWGAHAVAHVLEAEDRVAEGTAWVAGIDAGGVNNFAGHLAWHEALFHLGRGDTAAALDAYDRRIEVHLGRDYRDVANAATLLWRLEREAVDVGGRWTRVAEASRARLGDHVLGFADVHYVLALAAAGALGDARDMIASMRAAAADRPGHDAHVMQTVAVPVAEAILAHASADYAGAADLLSAARPQFVRLGGSHAQRDALELVLLDAALRGGREELAGVLLVERLRARPRNLWARTRAEGRAMRLDV